MSNSFDDSDVITYTIKEQQPFAASLATAVPDPQKAAEVLSWIKFALRHHPEQGRLTRAGDMLPVYQWVIDGSREHPDLVVLRVQREVQDRPLDACQRDVERRLNGHLASPALMSRLAQRGETLVSGQPIPVRPPVAIIPTDFRF